MSPDERETALAVLASLPSGAGIRHFIDAVNAETASRLGISTEALKALSPLLIALERFIQPPSNDRYESPTLKG